MDVIKTQQISARPVEKVIVHPFVLLSIVDNYNRVAKDTRKRVVGILQGSTYRGTVNVRNSYAEFGKCNYRMLPRKARRCLSMCPLKSLRMKLRRSVTGKLTALKGLDARHREIRSYLDLVISSVWPIEVDLNFLEPVGRELKSIGKFMDDAVNLMNKSFIDR